MLSGVFAAVLAVFVFLVAAALISTWRGRRRKSVAVRHEPMLVADRVDHQETVESFALPADDRMFDARPRRRFGGGALAMSFVFGIGAGVGAMAIYSNERFGPVVEAVTALIQGFASDARETEVDLAGSRGSVPDPGTTDAPPLPVISVPPPGSPPVVQEAGGIEARMAVFAAKLKETLPRDAGPEISLITVESNDMTLSLGYAVGRTLGEGEIPEFDAFIMRTVKSLFCGKEAREIRFLNENGVAFHMAYTDPSGATVARLTVPPDYCA